MLETEIKNHLKWVVARKGGKVYDIRALNTRGIADHLVCLPNGATWLIESKRPRGGKLLMLQREFAMDMIALKQNYARVKTKEEIDQWANSI